VKFSNAISLSRILLLVGHTLTHSFFPTWLNVAIVIFNYLLDAADGRISRKYGGTPYGEFMDISVDRVVTLGYFAFHTLKGRLHLTFFLLILIRNVILDYVSYFNMIKATNQERHKMTSGLHYWVYSSQISKIINGGLQLIISAWGFVSPVPLALELLFLLNSYVRGFPTFKKMREIV